MEDQFRIKFHHVHSVEKFWGWIYEKDLIVDI